MRISKQTTLRIFEIIAIAAVLYILSKLILIPLVLSEEFKNFTNNLGIFGYLVVVLYTILSHVFAPLSGSPMILVSITLYGLEIGMILLHLSSSISASINFWISRRFGRKLVTKLVGEKPMKEVDEFAALEGKKVLWISRILGFSIFELISYAAGLTKISFKDYFLITFVTSTFINIGSYLVFKNINLQTENGIFIWVGTMAGTGIIFGLLVKFYLSNKSKFN